MVGGGQLARMTYQAAIALGLTVRVLSDRADDSAARIGAEVEVGSPDEIDALRRFAAGCDVLTFDHELVPPEHLAALAAEGHTLHPTADTMALAQNKRRQRQELGALGLPVPAFTVVQSEADLLTFGQAHGWPGQPVVAKVARGGYDGRGVWVLEDAAAARRLWAEATARGVELIAEAWVPIEKEIAALVVRRPGGEAAVYPVVETVQVAGICREVLAPAGIPPDVAAAARDLARRIAEAVRLVGMLAVELFLVREDARPDGWSGRLVINELATRPHNSGHFSIEGCVTSQFENHVRAVLDWPLGDTSLVAPAAVMVNVLGGAPGNDPQAELPRALADPAVKAHLYGKAARPGRKLGHVTVLADTADEARARGQRAAAILMGEA
jgi:5-(carboxyamino)imidazole ribonucleotide synthase